MKRFLAFATAVFSAVIIALFSVLASAQTLTLNDSAIIQGKTSRIGLNIGSINNSDSGQILKNLIGSVNPGFEPLQDQEIWVLGKAGTAMTFTVPDVRDGVPPNYWTGGTFDVVESQSGGTELGCTGTILSNTGPNYPQSKVTWTSPVITASSPCSAPFSVGDTIILSKVVYPTPESWWESGLGWISGSVSGGGKLVSDTSDLCATCGTQALNMNATLVGSSATASWHFDDSNSGRIFTLMNGTYELSFWAKTAGGSPTLIASASRPTAGGFDCGTFTPTLTSTWAKYTFTCTASESPATTPGTAQVSMRIVGGAVYLDNVSFAKTSPSIDNPTVLRDEVIETLQRYFGDGADAPSGTFRYSFGQNGQNMPNWTQPVYAESPTATGAAYFVGPNGGGSMPLSLEDYLVICQFLGVEPYLEVPVTFSTADAANLIEFLAGPSGMAYGARRAALGQVDPWSDVFDKIHLSFCDECWNPDLAGENLPWRATAPSSQSYYDYSQRARDIFAAMRANDCYSANSFDLVMGAQTAVRSSMDAAIQIARPDSIEIDGYLYSTVNGFTPDSALWQPAMVEPYEKVTNPSDPNDFYGSINDYKSQKTCGASGTSSCNVNIYKWGQNTLNGSIDQTHLDYIAAGAGEGVVMALQPLLNLQYYGILAQALSSLTQYQVLASNGLTAKLRGNVVDMGGATNNVRPAFLGVSLVNESIIGPMYSCPIANNVAYDFAGSTNGTYSIPALRNVPDLYAFCFENGTKRSLVLINTDLAKSHTLSFAGSNPPTGSVTQRQYAPAALDDMNEAPTGQDSSSTSASVAIETSTLSSPSSITLPPYSVTALDYTALSAPILAAPKFSPAAGTYTMPQSVTLTSTPGTTIYYTTDGTPPTTSSSVYSGPITANSSMTLRAIAVATGYKNSSVAMAAYTISALLPALKATPAATSDASAGATVTISNTVEQAYGSSGYVATSPRIGVNMGGNTAYGQQQLLKSLNFSNNGYFASSYWRNTFQCSSVTGTPYTNDTTHWYNNSTPGNYPTNFFVGATYKAIAASGAVLGTGTITASAANSAYGPEFTLSNAMTGGCSSSGNIDMIVIDYSNAAATVHTPAQSGLNVCGTASWDTSDTSPSSTNTTQSLEMPSGCTLGLGMDQTLQNATNTNSSLAATGVNWINLNGSYTTTFKAKCLTSGCSLTFSVVRGGTTYIGSTTVNPTYNVTPGAGWTTYTYPFTASETGSQQATIQYNFSNSGTVLLQDADVIEGSTLAGNTTPFRDAVVRKLQALNPGSLRWMDGSDWCSTVADETAAVGTSRICGVNNYNVGTEAPTIPYAERLALCAFLKTDCWITVGNTTTASEWTALISWLSSQGWISTFAANGNKIYLEDGNEQWNFGVSGTLWAGNGAIYGDYLGPNMAAAKAASGYNSSVIKLVGSSWAASNQGYGAFGWAHNTLTTASGTTNGLPDIVDNAPYMLDYLGSFDTSGSNVATTGAPFLDEWAEDANIDSVTSPPANTTSMYKNVQYIKTTWGLGTGVYEVNYSTINGISTTQLQMNQIAGSVGQALATAQHVLLLERDSGVYAPIHLFQLAQQFTNYNNTKPPAVPIWGEERYMACGPGQLGSCADVDRPASIALQVINNAIGSNTNLMSVSQSSTPTFSYAGGQDQSGSPTILANSAVPYVNCFAYANNAKTNWTTICFNNNLTTAETVTLAGAGVPTGSVTQTTFPGPSNLITDNNENTYLGASSIAPVVGIPTPTTTSGTTYTIPPASVIALTYSTTGNSTPPAATPTFSVPAGTYPSAQTVTISDATAGATIYYTTNGTTPTTSSAVYSAPITVSSTETLEAIAVETGYTNSAVASAAYTISTTAATPTFSVPAGTYPSAQTVTISDATAGATIYYTTNGTTPTTSSAVYSAPITVSSTETLEAIAVETGYTNSAVASAAYTISTTAATPTFSVPAGTYPSAQTVTISDATAGATIYYTTNGTTPTTASAVYSAPITVSSTETLEAIAVKTGYSNSAVASAAYTISTTAATPTFSVPARNVPQCADGHDLGCDGGRDHLLHHQRNYADHFIGSLFSADHGKFDGDAGGHCGEDRLYQQRGGIGGLHHQHDRSDTDVLSAGRNVPQCADGHDLGCDGGRDHLLHHQRNYAYHFIGSLFSADHGKFDGDAGGHCGEDRLCQQRGGIGGLHHQHDRSDTDVLSAGRNVPQCADGHDLGCDGGRDHLLHHQRNYADHFIGSLFSADHGKFDGDAGGDCGEDRLHEQRGGIGGLHHQHDRSDTDVLSAGRNVPQCADGHDLGCDGGRDHLLHHQRNYAYHFIGSLFSADHGKFDGDAGGHCGRDRLHEQRGGIGGLHHQHDRSDADVLSAGRNVPQCADGHDLGCDGGRDDLLHHQRNYADHFIGSLFSADHGKFDGDAEGHCGEDRLCQQRGGIGGLHHQHDRSDTDVLSAGRNVPQCADGHHLGCDGGRDHLLHHQRNYAYHFIGSLFSADHGKFDGDAGGHCGRDRLHEQRGGIGGLHHQHDRSDTDVLSAGRNVPQCADGHDLGCDGGRDHLLHHQRNYAYHFIGSLFSTDHGKFDGDAGGHCGEDRLCQQRGGIGGLHHQHDRSDTDVLSAGRNVPQCADGHDLGCDGGRDHLLHHQRNYAYHFIGSLFSADHGKFDGDAGGHCGEDRLHEQRGGIGGLHHQHDRSDTDVLSLPAGTYPSAQTVTISDATAGATIYYTTNGTTPTTSSAVYSAPITVSSTETLEAIAVETGYTNSAVASAAYTISTTAATPTFQCRPEPIPQCADGHDLGCDGGRDHLLHHQRNYAYHFIGSLFSADHGKFDGDAGGHCGEDRLCQQRGGIGGLHHQHDRSDTDVLSAGRNVPQCADGHDLGCDGGRDHLLHHQRNYAYHFIGSLFSADHGKFDGDAGGHCGRDRLHK